MASELQHLLDNNRAWSEQVNRDRPGFFSNLAKQQAPRYMWIGCSDSRVPANEIIGLDPGEVFVHRNVANVVVATDLNCLSALQYAVDVLKVGHVLVVGHYGCGGVRAALDGTRVGLADNWLQHVRDVAARHRRELTGEPNDDRRADRLVELNAITQALHICETTIVRDAWERGQNLRIHAWVYSLKNGLAHETGFQAGSAAELVRLRQAGSFGLG